MKATAVVRSWELVVSKEPAPVPASRSLFAVALVLGSAVALAGCATPKGPTAEAKREDVTQMSDAALDMFYQADPRLKLKVRHAPGYAVFSTRAMKLLMCGSGNGYGVVHDNTTGDRTYMKMGRFGAGVGMGMTDNRSLFIFTDRAKLSEFLDRGVEIGGDANAVARLKDDGLAYKVSMILQPGMEIYELTRTGLSAEAMIYGTKYRKDGGLN